MTWWRSALDTVRRRVTRPRREPVPADQPRSVVAVLQRLREVERTLPAGDGVAAFNRMYLRVTEAVARRIDDGFFADRAFLTRLDIVFAGLYLRQITSTPDQAWAPLFEARGAAREPIQFAVAGMNAHINHDLPLALVRTCRQLGITPSSPGVRADYDAVSAVLAAVHEEVRQSFFDGFARELDARASPVTTLVASWSIARARDAAWVNAGVLWEIDGVEPLHGEFVGTLARSVGMTSRHLLTPLPRLQLPG
jgi:hypothetical protein